MLDKIDVRDIVRDHYRTLVSYGSNRPAIADYVLFLGIPTLVVALAAWLNVLLTETAVNVLITAVSILAGLLFNVLVLIHTVAERFVAPTGKKDEARFIKEIYSNIAYAILVSLAALVPLVVLVIAKRRTLSAVANLTALFILVHLGLTLLMILKRLHALLSFELGKARAG